MKRYSIMKYFVFRRFFAFSAVCLRFAYLPAVCAPFLVLLAFIWLFYFCETNVLKS